jgi:hypothetical protein
MPQTKILQIVARDNYCPEGAGRQKTETVFVCVREGESKARKAPCGL